MGFSQTVAIIWIPAPSLTLPKKVFMPISASSTINHSLPPQLLWHAPLQEVALPRRSTSHLATETFLRRLQTRFKSTSSSLVKISMLVIHCNGGLVTALNSLISLVLRGIFFLFLVSSVSLLQSFLLIASYVGSAVAVERIFSRGRDTISLRRASLKPETIKTLMLAKQQISHGSHTR